MEALAILTCCPNSHPFQPRHLSLREPVKIGRSVAQARPSQNNAIFDCKVLSRNHALLWYENGKFFLQDTKSSNGTFVCSQRLSKGSEESVPKEIYNNDILQFGVDVMENSRKVTHSCIIATIQLFHPDGQPAATNSDLNVSTNSSHLALQSHELYQLNQYIQEAVHREQMLENKLATLQRLVHSTQEASEHGWQALVDEDRLLSRLEALENETVAYNKNQAEGDMKLEMAALHQDKYNYETQAKESLRNLLEEKLEAVRKLTELERSLSNTEEECSMLQDLYQQSQHELQLLAEKHHEQQELINELQDKLKNTQKKISDNEEEYEREKVELQGQLDEKCKEEDELRVKIESLRADNDFTKEQLHNMKVKLESMKMSDDLQKIPDRENKGVQAELINLLDLQMLKSESDDEEKERC